MCDRFYTIFILNFVSNHVKKPKKTDKKIITPFEGKKKLPLKLNTYINCYIDTINNEKKLEIK